MIMNIDFMIKTDIIIVMKTKTLKIAIIAVLCMPIALTIVACNKKVDKDDEITFTSANWMARIDDNTLLSQISIPATHDSGAALDFALSQCQNLTIEEQLNVGIRCFDLRLGFSSDKSNDLEIYHGPIRQDVYFEDIVDTFEDFLEDNPSEAIAIFIKNENDADKDKFFDALNEYFEDEEDLFYLENAIPQIKDVRGKVVLLNRFDAGKNVGVNCANGWRDNAVFEMNNGVNCFVQDYYNLDVEDNLAVKWADIKELMTKDTGSDYVFNFTSGYVPMALGAPNIKIVSEYIHEKLIEEFSAMPDGNYGMILLDFADETLSKLIYEKNFD